MSTGPRTNQKDLVWSERDDFQGLPHSLTQVELHAMRNASYDGLRAVVVARSADGRWRVRPTDRARAARLRALAEARRTGAPPRLSNDPIRPFLVKAENLRPVGEPASSAVDL